MWLTLALTYRLKITWNLHRGHVLKMEQNEQIKKEVKPFGQHCNTSLSQECVMCLRADVVWVSMCVCLCGGTSAWFVYAAYWLFFFDLSDMCRSFRPRSSLPNMTMYGTSTRQMGKEEDREGEEKLEEKGGGKERRKRRWRARREYSTIRPIWLCDDGEEEECRDEGERLKNKPRNRKGRQ